MFCAMHMTDENFIQCVSEENEFQLIISAEYSNVEEEKIVS